MNEADDFSFALAFEGLRKRNGGAMSIDTNAAPAAAPRFGNPKLAAESLASRIAKAEARAALSGGFTPKSLGENVTHDPLELGALGEICTPDAQAPNMRWVLKWGERIRILRRLIADGRLNELLHSELPETDSFGLALRELLSGRMLENERSSEPVDLLAYSGAYDVAEELGLRRRPRWLPYAIALANDERARSIISQGFVGREIELERLKGFTSHQPQVPSQLRTLIVSGLGGAGKTALLGRFVEILGPDTITCTLDFDLPGVDPADEALLDSLVAQQLGLQLGHGAYRLVELGRRQFRRNRAATRRHGGSMGLEAASRERSERNVLSYAGAAVIRYAPQVLIVFIVLDTAEEVPLSVVDTLAQWSHGLYFRLGARVEVRLVVSGRLFDEAATVWRRAFRTDEPLILDQLKRPDAQRLLEQQGVASEQAARLLASEMLPRRPLELRLLARIVTEQGIASAEALEEDLRNGGEAARQLFAGVVYKRVLMRVSEEVRAIAHPGLVLRYVSVDLLREVLAPALDLGELSIPQATHMLDKLASYAWLARRDGERVWHRKDLRASVLLAMTSQDRQKAIRIHEGALRYHVARQQRTDATYHHLMLWGLQPESTKPPTVSDLQDAASSLGGYLNELPRPAAVLVRYAMQRQVEPDEVALLPAALRTDAALELGERLVQLREFGRAGALLESAGPHLPQQWARETLFTLGEWKGLAPTNFDRVMDFGDLVERMYPEAIARPTAALRDKVFAVLRHLPIKGDSGRITRDIERFSVCMVALAGRAPYLPDQSQTLLDFSLRLEREIETRELLPLYNRLLLLRILAEPEHRFEARGMVTPHSTSLHPRWIQRLRHLPSAVHESSDATMRFAEELKRAVHTGQTLEELLGAVDALGARKTFGDGVTVNLESADARDLVDGFFGGVAHLRDLSRYALVQAYRATGRWDELAALVARCAFRHVADFEHGAFTAALQRDAEHALLKPVEFLDRSGRMHSLLRMSARRSPDPRVRSALRAQEIWRKVLRCHWEPWTALDYHHKEP